MKKGFLPGRIYIRIVSADYANFLYRLNGKGISVFDVKQIDHLIGECSIQRKDWDAVQAIASRSGADLTILKQKGIHYLFNRVLHRPVLALGILALLFCTVYLPSRILFVQVKGNVTIPTEEIINKAEMCGIYFGAFRRDVRSEAVKNALISALPELQWVGVNTFGCVAEISVTEKTLPEEKGSQYGVSNIVAATDGIIQELTVTQGVPLCQVGQAVKRGQVIISGYADYGLVQLGTQAQGEVYAETRRINRAITPLDHLVRMDMVSNNKKISIKIGKNIIKLYNDSGISDARCVKMYKQEYLTLPGGFQLPLSLIIETEWAYQLTDRCEGEQENFNWLTADAQAYILGQTIAGKILSAMEDQYLGNGVCTLQGEYVCFEMIGRKQYEESILKNGSND